MPAASARVKALILEGRHDALGPQNRKKALSLMPTDFHPQPRFKYYT
jgi:hypothetical protein